MNKAKLLIKLVELQSKIKLIDVEPLNEIGVRQSHEEKEQAVRQLNELINEITWEGRQ